MSMMKYVTGRVDEIGFGRSVYLAAPFFNVQQMELVQKLEQLFESAKVRCFSPRLQHGNQKVKIETVEQARKVFTENEKAIKKCAYMVAVVDWLMPLDDELRVVREVLGPSNGVYESVSPRLYLPDAGTVWEMGYGHACGVNVVMFTTRPKEQRQNIMLTQGCDGVAYGFEQLEQFLEGDMSFSFLSQWEGGMQ